MSEAWVRRGIENQDLLENLKHQIEDLVEKQNLNDDENKRQQFHFCLYLAMMKYLTGTIYEQLEDEMKTCEATANGVFHQIVLPQIKKFARTPEEERSIIAELMEWATQTALQPIKSALQHQTIFEPERIFHAPTAMTEVSDNC